MAARAQRLPRAASSSAPAPVRTTSRSRSPTSTPRSTRRAPPASRRSASTDRTRAGTRRSCIRVKRTARSCSSPRRATPPTAPPGSTTSRGTARRASRCGGSIPNHPSVRAPTFGASCWARPIPRSCFGSTASCSAARSSRTDNDGTELAWPDGGRIRIETRADRAPGVDRLEVEGLAAPTNVLGTWFTPT